MDFTTAKTPTQAIWAPRTKETSAVRLVPVLSPLELTSLHMFGIPLVSAMPHPITKKRAEMTDAIIKAKIDDAIEQVEVDTGLTILPTVYAERQPFDKKLYDAWGYMQLTRRPVWSVSSVRWEGPDGQTLYTLPLEWIDVGLLYRGRISVVPYSIGFTQTGPVPPVPGSGGSPFLNVIAMSANWINAFWMLEYAAGFPDGMVPKIVNDLIGKRAVIEILGQLGATYASTNSTSIGVDGFSESVSTPGPNIYQVRIDQLEADYERIKGRVKTIFGLKLFTGTL